MDYFIPMETVAFRLLVAMALAFIIGLDRELKHKPYGFRPYIMLSIGSAAFTMMMVELANSSVSTDPNISVDTSRVISAVISGIGFLGAAAIINERKQLVGATTGTGIWVVGAVGIACGLGYYWHAVLLTLFAVIVMVALGQVHERIKENKGKEDA